MVRHEDVGAGRIKSVESDGLDSNAGEANAIPRSDHEHAIQQANIAGDKRPRKTDQSRDGRGQGPEDEHRDGADHESICLERELELSVRLVLTQPALLLAATQCGVPAAPRSLCPYL